MNAIRIAWLGADDPPDSFPAIETALREPDGLLAAGGDLTAQRILAAYRRGIFPWYDDGQPILWWSPNPRCILCPQELRVSRRLAQYARRSGLTVHFNTAFADVIRACAGERRLQQGTWITGEMISAYEDLHASGWAHSVEIRDDDRLVGGLYGLGIGRAFFGESMFSDVDNASKFAMLGLASQMLDQGLELIDCQVVSPHLLSLGARTIPRHEFAAMLGALCEPAKAVSGWPAKPIPVAVAWRNWRAAALQ